MLQYPTYSPLSSQAPKKSVVGKDHTDYFRYNDHRSMSNKRVHKDSFSTWPSYPFSSPLSISTNLSSSPTSSSPSPSKFLRSPYISSRQASSPVSLPGAHKTPGDSRPPSPAPSVASSTLEDVFAPGDIFGEGATLQGEPIKLVTLDATSAPVRSQTPDCDEPAKEFEVVRRLGAGSYAVVYLVCEVLYRPPPSEDGHSSVVGALDVESVPKQRPSTVYGREYAIKCLSKANLDEDALAAQMTEVTIHQSLRPHPNIVTLHRTFETPSFLLLLLEYVPGEDLFYFLEQARDHYESEADSPDSADSSTCSSRTPPTPSLLSSMNPGQQLSRTRLRLISSMFSQMCDAVAACHDQQVFHRDIKPENFIVTDGWSTTSDGRQERKVVVKLTDFGLSTNDIHSSDMDCGSAPYMSYECRNNLAPTYRPRAADVWSLGIVLINMLYHCNPWTDTAQGACNTFNLFLYDPVNFFMNRFAGMTRPVADVLANRVFNILDDPDDDSKRISASGFGAWIRDLPELLADEPKLPPSSRHQRNISLSSTQGFSISATTPMSHRPQSRQASGGTAAVRTPAMPPSRSLSRAPSLGPAFEHSEACELSTVIDQEIEEQELEEKEMHDTILEGSASRSTSNTKRRKRGARKGKGSATMTPTTPNDDTLVTLAVASQSLARELSKASKATTQRTTSTNRSSASRRSRPYEPVSMYPVPTPLLTSTRPTPSSAASVTSSLAARPPSPPPSSSASVAPAPVTKKPSKWKLSFGKASAASLAGGRTSPTEEVSSILSGSDTSSPPVSGTASNVKSLLMGLDARTPATNSLAVNSTSSLVDDPSTWNRGRRGRGSPPRSNYHNGNASRSPLPANGSNRWAPDGDKRSDRAISPNSTRSGRPLASSASSVVSSNWRSSMSTTSSAGTSTSAFTRYSNSSVRSVSTAATSVSSNSWRTNGKPPVSPSHHAAYPGVPKNIKIMDGVPWELFELPRGQRPEIAGDSFGGPPARKQRTRKPKDLALDTISERPPNSASNSKSPNFQRRDAATSTTDLSGIPRNAVYGSGSSGNQMSLDDLDNPKKVQKGQINALAKMLSALRR